MDENNQIDDFNLDMAKRNMAKMMEDAQGSTGLKKVFANRTNNNPEKFEDSSKHTINIYPSNNQSNDVQLALNNFLNQQMQERRYLSEKVESLEKVEGRLTELELVLKQQIAQQSKMIEMTPVVNPIEKYSKIGFLVAIFILVIGLFYFIDDVEDEIKQIATRKPAIVEKVEKVQKVKLQQSATTTKKLRFVTTKFVNLRSKPSVNVGRVLQTISPNQVLNVVEDNTQWSKVIYKNHLQSNEHVGWVFKENLKRL